MSKIPITYEIAHAAGTDAGNRSMAKAGRKAWNPKDLREAVRAQEELLKAGGLSHD